MFLFKLRGVKFSGWVEQLGNGDVSDGAWGVWDGSWRYAYISGRKGRFQKWKIVCFINELTPRNT